MPASWTGAGTADPTQKSRGLCSQGGGPLEACFRVHAPETLGSLDVIARTAVHPGVGPTGLGEKGANLPVRPEVRVAQRLPTTLATAHNHSA